MQFLRKKLAGVSVISNDMLRYSTGQGALSADQFVLDDMIQVIVLAEDLSLIRGDGTAYAPRGLRNLLVAANVFAQTGVTLATVDADHAKALRLVEEANILIEPDSIHWIIVPRTYYGLMNIAPATDAGARPYRSGLEIRDAKAPSGRILGFPVHKTNQIPKNLGGGTETETYCAHGPSMMIADTLNTQIDVFPGGAYEDSGVVVSGISKDETPVRVIREMDFNLRYQEAGSCLTAVTLA
jgi:HK97 family phage major capsid protein